LAVLIVPEELGDDPLAVRLGVDCLLLFFLLYWKNDCIGCKKDLFAISHIMTPSTVVDSASRSYDV